MMFKKYRELFYQLSCEYKKVNETAECYATRARGDWKKIETITVTGKSLWCIDACRFASLHSMFDASAYILRFIRYVPIVWIYINWEIEICVMMLVDWVNLQSVRVLSNRIGSDRCDFSIIMRSLRHRSPPQI